MKLLLALLFLAAPLACFSQAQALISIAGGANYTNLSSVNDTKNGWKICNEFSASAGVSIHRTTIKAGFGLLTKAGVMKSMRYTTQSGQFIVSYKGPDMSLRYMNIPVSVEQKFLPEDKKFNFGVGIVSNLSFFYSVTYETLSQVVNNVPQKKKTTYHYDDLSTGKPNIFQFAPGLKLFVSYEVLQNLSLQLDVHGYRDVIPYAESYKTYGTYLGSLLAVQYNFGGSVRGGGDETY